MPSKKGTRDEKEKLKVIEYERKRLEKENEQRLRELEELHRREEITRNAAKDLEKESLTDISDQENCINVDFITNEKNGLDDEGSERNPSEKSYKRSSRRSSFKSKSPGCGSIGRFRSLRNSSTKKRSASRGTSSRSSRGMSPISSISPESIRSMRKSRSSRSRSLRRTRSPRSRSIRRSKSKRRLSRTRSTRLSRSPIRSFSSISLSPEKRKFSRRSRSKYERRRSHNHRIRKMKSSSISDYERSEKRRSSSFVSSPRHRRSRRSRLSSSSSSSSGTKIDYLFLDTKYFLIKSSNHDNVSLSQMMGLWSTPPPNEMRFNEAFRKHSNVILIFSVKESGCFQGYARITSESNRNHPPIKWVFPVGISPKMLSGVFTIDWINKKELSFDKVFYIRNSLNENLCVKIGRDGQEIDAESGEALCLMFGWDSSLDLKEPLLRSKLSLQNNKINLSETKNIKQNIKKYSKHNKKTDDQNSASLIPQNSLSHHFPHPHPHSYPPYYYSHPFPHRLLPLPPHTQLSFSRPKPYYHHYNYEESYHRSHIQPKHLHRGYNVGHPSSLSYREKYFQNCTDEDKVISRNEFKSYPAYDQPEFKRHCIPDHYYELKKNYKYYDKYSREK